jgi:uncharacterized CHY-type Zn-finger protein
MRTANFTAWTLRLLTTVFLFLAVAFIGGLWGRPPKVYPIPPVDPEFTRTDTVRQSYNALVAAGADLTEFDCYLCHEEGKPPPLRFDEHHKLIIPDEHSDIVMEHGQHDRNNNCFNCHNELNLLKLQTRDGRELGFAESPMLCGSCHGPTYRDWEAGAHGRTGGSWDPASGKLTRQDCVSCHNPHSPRFPSRQPAPGPHPLHLTATAASAAHGGSY